MVYDTCKCICEVQGIKLSMPIEFAWLNEKTIEFYDLLLFSSRSVRGDSESQLPNQFPFLPSYEMAMNEVRESQQNINATLESMVIDNGVILEIRNTEVVPPSTESRSNIIEANANVNTPRNYSRDDEEVSETGNSSVNQVLQNSHGSVEEHTEANVTSSSGNCRCSSDNKIDEIIGRASVQTCSEE